MKRKANKGSSSRKKTEKKTIKLDVHKEPQEITIKTIEIPKKEASKEEEERPPSFFDVNEKNLRNNFGQPMKDKSILQNELFELNQKLYPEVPETVRSEPIIRKNDAAVYTKSNKRIIWTTVVIALAILLGFVLFFLLSRFFSEQYIDNGKCMVHVDTLDQGKKEGQYIDIPSSECHYASDCEAYLEKASFTKEDIDKMKLKCIGN
jgi:hypothetical protein